MILRYKLKVLLTLCALFSFVVKNESYIGIVDYSTYRTVTNFADECVKWKYLKHMPIRRLKKLKRFRLEDEVCFQTKQKYCPSGTDQLTKEGNEKRTVPLH
ncbi:uncharacterized protein LOC111328115 [Stylophora pistillata]|uniref:uncharacterized protein LOC111328115 n=1 Tax=Stylophora pistillata TaxID=50429 RepID=UPI000C03EF30|nr:uncharacterized protein LOC111328115 [Stylophora pistillata]